MSDNAPGLHMLNVVARDMAASRAFDRRLAIAVPPGWRTLLAATCS
jgi:hypothetical protein